ncbi:Lipoprotein signal peptidase [Caenispirillum salinarum AK4]|uniref:Lipoprotein signal peptidase n=1 Tax=Caenispirillum salinarum AK4 TaxID=1238182 RepID=K9HVR0_9PROT|nr:signal peptidase II [Caenispirillum salinarum]EKV32326.1 Lipoprotein signal peptidase [Caenispirillum salinarum AK4]
MSFRPRRLVPGLILALVILVVDQLSKIYIVGSVMDPPRVIEVTGFFNLVMAWNYGVSFGLFNEPGTQRWMLIALALAVSAALAVWMTREPARATRLALGAIIGGAIGNVIDRVRWGAVADFLDFHAFGYHWPAFNVADAAIVVGAAVLVLDNLFRPAAKESD